MGDCDDDFVSCPYDLTHRVRRSKLPLHVAKCEWLNPELIACPYNIWHRYTQRDMPSHIRVCSSKPVPQDFVAEFQKNVPKSTIEEGIDRGNYAAADVAEARALAYPTRPSAGPLETYRPRASFYVPRAYIPLPPRMSSMSLVRGHHIRNFDDDRDRPHCPNLQKFPAGRYRRGKEVHFGQADDESDEDSEETQFFNQLSLNDYKAIQDDTNLIMEPSYIKIENSERPYLCLVCNKTYKRKDHLKLHSMTHMKKDKVCTECGKAFHRDQQLLVHMNTHLNSFPHEPDDAEYDDQGAIILDESNLPIAPLLTPKSEVRNHECPICHKRFKRKQHLKVHANVHLKNQVSEFTVWCSNCNEGFRTNPEFEAHPCMSLQLETSVKIENMPDDMMEYTEGDADEANPPQEAKKENKYPLDFVEVDLGNPEEPEYLSIKNECSIPVPQRVYVCKYCSKPFKRKDHYKIHLHIHTGVKSFFCPHCGKGFYRKDHMQKHVQVHTKPKLKPKRNIPELLRITNMIPKTEVRPEITIHAPSSAKLRVPLQIKVPYQMVMSTDSGEQCAVTINPAHDLLRSETLHTYIHTADA